MGRHRHNRICVHIYAKHIRERVLYERGCLGLLWSARRQLISGCRTTEHARTRTDACYFEKIRGCTLCA